MLILRISWLNLKIVTILMTLLYFPGTLWDNSPLDADVPFVVKAWNEKYAYPKVIISGGHEIMSMIEEKYGKQLPVVTGDYTEYWTDGIRTAARTNIKE